MMRAGKHIFRILGLSVIGLMVSSVCADALQQELSGAFISDKDATLDYLRSTGVYTQEQLEKLAAVMGKMKVTFNGDTVVTELDDSKTSEQFKVIEQESDHIVILTNLEGEPVTNRIEFVSDGYWLVNPLGDKPFREKFKRIP